MKLISPWCLMSVRLQAMVKMYTGYTGQYCNARSKWSDGMKQYCLQLLVYMLSVDAIRPIFTTKQNKTKVLNTCWDRIHTRIINAFLWIVLLSQSKFYLKHFSLACNPKRNDSTPPKTSRKSLFNSVTKFVVKKTFSISVTQPRKVQEFLMCHLGNQAEFVLGSLMNTNQQKNFIGMDISSFTIWLLDCMLQSCSQSLKKQPQRIKISTGSWVLN